MMDSGTPSELTDVDLGRALAASKFWWMGEDSPKLSDGLVKFTKSSIEEGSTITLWSWRDILYQNGTLKVSPSVVAMLSQSWVDLVSELPRVVDGVGRVAPRLALVPWNRTTSRGLARAFRALAQPEIGFGAVMVGHSLSRTSAPNWHWPVRIAVLASGAEKTDALLRQWRSVVQASPWLDEISVLSPLSARTEQVDVVFFDGEHPERAIPRGVKPRAQFAVQRVKRRIGMNAALTRAEKLAETYRAFGTAILQPDAEPGPFLKEFVRNLSHDYTVHAAVWNVPSPLAGSSLPIIVGQAGELDRMSILSIAESFSTAGRQDMRASGRRLRFDFHPARLSPDVLAPRRMPPERIGLAAEIQQRRFDSESEGGVPAAVELADADRRHLEASAEGEARLVQMAVVNAFEPNAFPYMQPLEIDLQLDGRFVADAVNMVRVRIAAEDVQASADVVFPTNALHGNGEATIEVRFEVVNGAIVFADSNQPLHPAAFEQVFRSISVEGGEEQHQSAATGVIHLPRKGPSTDAYFLIRAFAHVGELLQGALLLSVNRRLLQAVDVSILTSGREEPGSIEQGVPPITLAVRAQHFAEFIDAAERREFDLGLFVDDGSRSSAPRIVAIDSGESGVPLKKLETVIADISTLVGKIAYREQVDVRWTDELVIGQLRAIAEHGSLMRETLGCFWPTDKAAPERIAIAGPWEEYVPIEYVYEGPAPDFSATLCDQAPHSFEAGSCGDCPHRRSPATVCPLRFWGFSSEIERRYADTIEEAVPGRGPTRRRMKPVVSSLFGYSERAGNFAGGPAQIQVLLLRLSQATGRAVQATDWSQWRADISAHAPNVLILVPHTGTYEQRDALEIGPGTAAEHWRSRAQISREDVGLSDEVEFVALLGCNTTQIGTNFATFPAQFRKYGADLLLTTIATLRGADAVPIAKEVAEMLEEAKTAVAREMTFGSFVTELRRRALLKGAPGVLGVVGYGDSDWIVSCV